MNTITKVIIQNKEWLLKSDQLKIGSIAKDKKGYVFLKSGKKFPLKNMDEIADKFGISMFDNSAINATSADIYSSSDEYAIYDYPCSSKPFNPLYNVKKKLPLYSKNVKSKSRHCAGYYIVQFQNGWVRSFCPKLITLERYPYHGPFKNEAEMRQQLTHFNKL